ncbi:MAG: MMPL family transporter [Acidobacteria bacterium]|nr:MMPL family transporter [Acidobacteriota bacterium]
MQNSKSGFAVWVVAHPRLILVGVVALTIVFALGLALRGLRLNVSPMGFVENESQARTDYENTRAAFGNDLFLIIAVVSDDTFSPANLTKLRALHQQITALSGVAEIYSLINTPYARSTADGASLEKLLPENFPEAFNDAARIAEARQTATTDRLFVGNLVSADGKTAALNVLFKAELTSDQRYAIIEQIYRMTKQAGFAESYLAGDPFSQWRGVVAIKRDLGVFLPLTLLLITAVLWLLSGRSLMATALPLITVGIGLLWLLGLMAWVQVQFRLLGLMLPTLMLAIGCSYLIHVINQIGIEDEKSKAEGRSPEDRICRALSFITLPVVVSALTIIAGFLSLAFTKIPAVRETAVFAAIGAAFTMILSLSFVPAVLALMGDRLKPLHVGLSGRTAQWLEGMGRWATDHQKFLYVLTVIIALWSIAGIRRIEINIDYFHFFKENSETSIGVAEVQKRLAGVVTFDVVIEGKSAAALEDAQSLNRIIALQQYLESPIAQGGLGIDRTLSVADFVRHSHRAFNGNRAEFYSIPNDANVLSDLLTERDQLKAFFTRDGKTARILVRSNLAKSSQMAPALRAIEAKGKALFPDARVFATGTFVLLNRTSDAIAGEQVLSISLALVTIFVMLSLLFRSARVGFTALVPNLIPVMFFFGYMGWFHIPLNLTTSLVASVVLGLAVDNAVQFIVRFRRVQTHDGDLREAIIESMRLSGRPIIYANVALAATFAVFALSEFDPIGSFGLLSAVTIIGCLIEDLILLPSRLTSPIFRAK